jgi:hypothetical protein
VPGHPCLDSVTDAEVLGAVASLLTDDDDRPHREVTV